MNRITKLLIDRALANPDRIAIDPVSEQPIGYLELSDRTEDLALKLIRSFRRDRPVALQLDHGAGEAVLELALLTARVPALSLPAFFTPEQSRHAISACGAQALFESTPIESAMTCRSAPVALPPGTARITFTSGSTGTPKGVCLSTGHMLTVAQSVVGRIGSYNAGRHLALLPPGLLLETVAGFFASLLAGGTYVCPTQATIGMADPFRPDFKAMAQAIRELRINSLILVPEYLAGLVGELERSCLGLPTLQVVAVGGARTSPELLQRAARAGLPVRQGYGLTECGSVVALEDESQGTRGSVGRPLDHLNVTIADDGEIMVDGPTCLGTVGGKSPGGPLATGDIGRIDDQGHLWIEGRKSNLIVTSFGRNISPEWIEEVLVSQPEIAQAMVHGDGRPAPEALLVASHPDVDLATAVARANSRLPRYAQIARWREAAPFTPHNAMLTGNGRLRRGAIAKAYLTDEPSFFIQLEAGTSRERLRFITVPQVRAGLSGTISRATYISYLSQAWHHVRHTVPLLRSARARLLDRPDLADALDEYIAEEEGHDEWILADIAAAGGDADAVRSSEPGEATRAMVDHAYFQIETGNPVSLFGMVYVLESVSIALAQRGASAVAQKLGLPPAAFTYLNSHGALDQEHMRFFARLVNGLDDPADRGAIMDMARAMFGLFGNLFASIEMEPADVAA